MLYEGIIMSVFRYCISVWGGLSKNELEDLQVIQNKAIRVVFNLPPRTHRNTMFDESGYMSIKQEIYYHTVLNIYKIKNTKQPEYLYDRLSQENIFGNIVLDKTNLTLARNGFIYRGSMNWNSLPPDIRKLKKLKSFKTEVKKWILENVTRFP